MERRLGKRVSLGGRSATLNVATHVEQEIRHVIGQDWRSPIHSLHRLTVYYSFLDHSSFTT